MSRTFNLGKLGAPAFTNLSDTPNGLPLNGRDVRVNPKGDALEFYEADDDSGGEPLSFTFLERLSNIGATQAVASDGKYLYVTGFPFGYPDGHDFIMKYDKQGNLITQNPSATTDGIIIGTQVNSMFIKDGLLYTSCNNYLAGQSNASKRSAIKVFDTETLEYITEYRVRDNICEGYCFHEGTWWGVYNDLMLVVQRDENWNEIASYPLTYTISGNFFYQGIVWIDDFILVNVHDGNVSQPFLDVYQWTGSGFTEVRRIGHINPAFSGQGICKEPGKNILWWAERYWPAGGSGPTGTSNVVKTRINYLVPTTNN